MRGFYQRIVMKSIIFLIGVGLLTLVGTVGCDEGHEHGHRSYGGAYDGSYQDSGRGYYDRDGVADEHGYSHH
jgi:hypothetical protein